MNDTPIVKNKYRALMKVFTNSCYSMLCKQ